MVWYLKLKWDLLDLVLFVCFIRNVAEFDHMLDSINYVYLEAALWFNRNLFIVFCFDWNYRRPAFIFHSQFFQITGADKWASASWDWRTKTWESSSQAEWSLKRRQLIFELDIPLCLPLLVATIADISVKAQPYNTFSQKLCSRLLFSTSLIDVYII